MPTLPASDNSLLARTAFEDCDAWARLLDVVATETDDGFRAYVETVDNDDWAGATVRAVRDAIRAAEGHAAIAFVVDEVALRDGFPVLVLDLSDADRLPFRCAASELWGVDNNLNIGNMDWEEFAGAVDVEGVFRGFA